MTTNKTAEQFLQNFEQNPHLFLNAVLHATQHAYDCFKKGGAPVADGSDTDKRIKAASMAVHKMLSQKNLAFILTENTDTIIPDKDLHEIIAHILEYPPDGEMFRDALEEKIKTALRNTYKLNAELRLQRLETSNGGFSPWETSESIGSKIREELIKAGEAVDDQGTLPDDVQVRLKKAIQFAETKRNTFVVEGPWYR